MKIKNWIYAAYLGLILIVIQIIQSHTMIGDMTIELFGFGIAAIFLSIGVWLGIQIYQKKEVHMIAKTGVSSMGLSAREMDVLELMVDGFSNQEIADGLFVSLNTTKTHISKIYQKLNVKRRTQAVQKAHELQLIKGFESEIA